MKVSANFVDGSNLGAALEAMALSGLVNPGARTLGGVLGSAATARLAATAEAKWAAEGGLVAGFEPFREWKARWGLDLSPAEAEGLARAMHREHAS
jgi:hypothetical protein